MYFNFRSLAQKMRPGGNTPSAFRQERRDAIKTILKGAVISAPAVFTNCLPKDDEAADILDVGQTLTTKDGGASISIHRISVYKVKQNALFSWVEGKVWLTVRVGSTSKPDTVNVSGSRTFKQFGRKITISLDARSIDAERPYLSDVYASVCIYSKADSQE